MVIDPASATRISSVCCVTQVTQRMPRGYLYCCMVCPVRDATHRPKYDTIMSSKSPKRSLSSILSQSAKSLSGRLAKRIKYTPSVVRNVDARLLRIPVEARTSGLRTDCRESNGIEHEGCQAFLPHMVHEREVCVFFHSAMRTRCRELSLLCLVPFCSLATPVVERPASKCNPFVSFCRRMKSDVLFSYPWG